VIAANLITSSDLANRLNVTRRTIYRMIKENQIPKKRVRGQWRFDWSEVQTHLKLDQSSRILTSEIEQRMNNNLPNPQTETNSNGNGK